MRAPRVRHLVLVVSGTVLVGSGSVLAGTAPRAEAPDIGSTASVRPPDAAAVHDPGRPLVPDRLEPRGAAAPLPATTTVEPSASAPVQVVLPHTPAPVPLTPVGVLPFEALQLPARPSELGWLEAGAVLGDPAGTAVIAGHLDSARYGSGPLEVLLHLGEGRHRGDRCGGVGHRFAATGRTSYVKSALQAEVFRTDGAARLSLITCGGAFDEQTGDYAENVVVLAEPIA